MKSYEEIARNAIRKARTEKIRIRRIRLTVLSSCAAVFAIGACLWLGMTSGRLPAVTEPTTQTAMCPERQTDIARDPAPVEPSTDASRISGAEEASEPVPTTVRQEGIPFARGGSPEDQSGGLSYVETWSVPSHFEVRFEGEELTDEEAAKYFESHLPSLSSALSASGVACTNLTVSPGGILHMNVGDEISVRRNVRDYYAYEQGKLTAILTLIKENGEIFCTPSFGAPWFSTLQSFLTEHRGQDLIWIYFGGAEYVLDENDGIFSPLGLDSPESLAGRLHFEELARGGCVYVP